MFYNAALSYGRIGGTGSLQGMPLLCNHETNEANRRAIKQTMLARFNKPDFSGSVSVMITGLEEVHFVLINTVNDTVFLREPSGPRVARQMLEWFGFSFAFKRAPDAVLNKFKSAGSHLAVMFDPMRQVFPEGFAEDGNPSFLGLAGQSFVPFTQSQGLF